MAFPLKASITSWQSALAACLSFGLIISLAGLAGTFQALQEGYHPYKDTRWIIPRPIDAVVNPRLTTGISYIVSCNKWAKIFISLFLFRYVRLVVNLAGFLAFRSTALPKELSLTPNDVTVIVPTVDPGNPDFEECITSIAKSGPAKIIIVVANDPEENDRAECYQERFPSLSVVFSRKANKRAQICQGLQHADTRITITCDDHVFWPETFLKHVLAPFEKRSVGIVGTRKRVRRISSGLSWASFWNFLGGLYLERHNFEIAATNHLDGGVFVISGRTAAYRTSILKDPKFIHDFQNEYTFFDLFGPLNVDDDNFITRWMVTHGWQIKMQHCDEATIETTLGTYPRFLSQCLRWSRSTWRSNFKSLVVDKTVWYAQPWCVYAVYLSALVNFALFYDAALIYTLILTVRHSVDQGQNLWSWVTCFCVWILGSKLVKTAPHFWRNPKDIGFLPGYILFGYYHSLIKLWALFTFWDISWNGRPALVSQAKDTHTDGDTNVKESSDGGK